MPTEDPIDISADQPESKSSRSPRVRSINRVGIGTMAVIQIVSAAIAVIALNYLSCTTHKRFDWTQYEDFTLSPRTVQYLASPEIRERTRPIHMVAVVKQSSTYYQRLRAQLENYQRFADGHITLEFVDPIRDGQRLQDLTTTYQRDLYEETILIDAREEADATPAKDKEKEKEKTLDLATNVRTFPVSSLFIEQFDSYKKKFIAVWQDENLLSSYLLSAVEGKPRKFYFVVDKSRIDDKAEGAPAWETYQQLLLTQNIQLLPLQISTTQKIPADAEGIALIGPSYDFDEREISTLQEYWDRPSSAIFVTLDPAAKLKHLRRFLREYGITPQDNRVIKTENGQTLTAARGFFTQGPETNKGLAIQATQLDGNSQGLEVQTNNDRLNIRNISAFSLIQASDGWWGESDYTEPNPTFDPRSDHGIIPGTPNSVPVTLAAAVVRGRENDDLTNPLTSRMIVIGNTDFLEPNNLREELTQFVNSSINWLVGREALIGIGPKNTYRKKITIQAAHKSFLDQTFLAYLPLTSLLIALVIWNSRRR